MLKIPLKDLDFLYESFTNVKVLYFEKEYFTKQVFSWIWIKSCQGKYCCKNIFWLFKRIQTIFTVLKSQICMNTVDLSTFHNFEEYFVGKKITMEIQRKIDTKNDTFLLWLDRTTSKIADTTKSTEIFLEHLMNDWSTGVYFQSVMLLHPQNIFKLVSQIFSPVSMLIRSQKPS